MTSIFDRDVFNGALFYPRPDATPPRGAVDRFVDVDGARLHVRCHEVPAARCTLLLFHGNGEVVADYDHAAAGFARCGAALAVADFRGYGRSTGRPSLRAEIADARPVAEAVRTSAPLVVMGRSLGSAAAHALDAEPIDGMTGVILESGFFDLRALIRRRGLTPPPGFTADELATFDPATKLARGTLPLLVLHGASDLLIDASEAVHAHAAAGDRAELVLIDGHGHNDVSAAEGYWRALAAFIARVT